MAHSRINDALRVVHLQKGAHVGEKLLVRVFCDNQATCSYMSPRRCLTHPAGPRA